MGELATPRTWYSHNLRDVTIDRHSDRPAYKQLADLLREQITAGDLTGFLPAEGELAQQYGLSLNTVKQATGMLRTEGLIVTGRGRRNRVRPGRVVASQRYKVGKGNYGPDVESAFAREHGVPWSEFEVTREIGIAPCPPRIAALLDIAPGTDVYERQFTHAIGGLPLRVSWSYLPAERFAGTILVDPEAEMAPGGTISQLHQIGIDVTSVRTEVQQRRATPAEATALRIPADAWVLEACRSMRTEVSGAAVEVALHIYPPDRGHVLVFDTQVEQRWYGRSPD